MVTSRDRLLELVDGYLAGALSAGDLAELERALIDQPDARRVFWLAVNHEVLLRQFPFAAPAAVEPTRTWWRRPQIALAAAALLLIGWALVHVTGGHPSGNGRPAPGIDAALAEIVAVEPSTGDHGVLHHHGRSEPLRVGLAVRDGDRIEVADGASADLRFQGEDTRLGLGSGSALSLADSAAGARLRLERGSLAAEVAHQPSGRRLAIATPQALVEVVGTRFVVACTDERTSVAVEQGRVRVSPTDAASGAAIDVGAGQNAIAAAGKPPALATAQTLAWRDRRPIGVMMLCRPTAGWTRNPRGWLSDDKLDVTTPDGVAALHRRLDAMIDQSIANLREIDAQALVFWDLEGLDSPLGYLGDPRQLAALAPEMDAVVDRLMARVRAAGLAVGVAVRCEEVVPGASGAATTLRAVADPARLVQAKIAYAQRRWGATIFPLLGQNDDALNMSGICRRVLAAAPGVLLIPTSGDAQICRWGAPWLHPDLPDTTQTIVDRAIPGAFSVIAPLEDAYLQQHRDELVRLAALGDVLTVRAWYRTAGHQLVKDIHAAAQRTTP